MISVHRERSLHLMALGSTSGAGGLEGGDRGSGGSAGGERSVSPVRRSAARASKSGCSAAAAAPTESDRGRGLQAHPVAGEDLGLAIERPVVVVFRHNDISQ